jgi:hypothetical protein
MDKTWPGCARGGPTAALAIACVTLGGSPAAAQEKLTEHTYTRSADAPSATARVEDMAWLAGHWVGEGLGGTVEEVWSPPRGGVMMGMFRLLKGDETAFYELMTLVPSEESLILRLKHFDADLTGWEEKGETADFPLVAVADGAFRFEGVSFVPQGRDRFALHLAMHQQDGSVREVTFSYERVPGVGREP